MGLMDTLGGGSVAIDTVCFIYWIEEHPRYVNVLTPLFSDVAEGQRTVFTSAVTLLEVLVVPYRAGNQPLAEAYEQLLTRSRGVRLVDVDAPQLRAAAQLRAAYRIKTPDALQVAAALSHRCTVLVTNDRKIPEIPGLRVVQLRAFAAS